MNPAANIHQSVTQLLNFYIPNADIYFLILVNIPSIKVKAKIIIK